MESILAIGDLHGHFDLLRQVIKNILPGLNNTRLIFLGDYIDCGPDSKQLVETLMLLQKQRPDAVLLMGNHEKTLLNLLKQPDSECSDDFIYNGGQTTLDSYGVKLSQIRKIPAHHQEFFRSLPVFWESRDYIFVHGGLRPGVPLAKQNCLDMLTIRERFFNSNYAFAKKSGVWPHPFSRASAKKYCLGIDTGAVYGQYLSCVLLPQMKFFKIN